jgi:beta-N-acetylhexosaminidase
MAGGVLPVVKHIPGHGRAMADSHLELPVVHEAHAVLSATDFAVFRALSDMPSAMTAHVVFSALDAAAPASTSHRVTQEIIRGEIGFDGLLMSDDLSMKALTGAFGDRCRAVLAAGSDLALHCNGVLAEMEQVAEAAPSLSGDALRRFNNALQVLKRREDYDTAAAERHLSLALGTAGRGTESV